MEHLKDFSNRELLEILVIFRKLIKRENKDSESYRDLRNEIMLIYSELKRRESLIGVTYRNGIYGSCYKPSIFRRLCLWLKSMFK